MDRIVRIKNKKYILSVSFANYLKDKTGMPKVMMAHQVMYNSVGISYISLFSVKKNILHDKVMLFCKFESFDTGSHIWKICNTTVLTYSKYNLFIC